LEQMESCLTVHPILGIADHRSGAQQSYLTLKKSMSFAAQHMLRSAVGSKSIKLLADLCLPVFEPEEVFGHPTLKIAGFEK